VKLETVIGTNPIRRQDGVSAQPRFDMSKYLDVMVLCESYADEDGKLFDDGMFINCPTMKRELKKDKGGGGQCLASSVSLDGHHKLEKMGVCN
jgi:hypothetical protein